MLRVARIAGIALASAVLVAGIAFLVLRTSVSQTRGVVRIPAAAGGHVLFEDVRIVRDDAGVPHIEAASRSEAVFGLGFAHAQDRLWQMEFQRRVGSGTLAEAVGAAGLSTDRFLRTLGVRHAAEAALEALDDDDRMLLDAYVAGVNAFLATRTGVLPPEFLILGVRPEPWEPVDVLVWQKMMAWDLTGGKMSAELLRARLVAALGADRAGQLFPPYPSGGPVIAAERADLYRRIDWSAFADALPVVSPANGSNAWAVSAAHSDTARPLLANDPHLGLQAPSLWYFAHLIAPEYEVIGATLPGTPAVLLGHNGSIAWGFTNAGSDVLDLFIERVDSEDPDRYLVPGGSEPFTVRREVIRVAGGDDVELEVRETRHGPVISDAVGAAGEVAGDGHVIALRWTALDADDTTLGAALDLGTATSWDSFVAALERWVVPQQVMAYADVDGNIGLIAPARVPIRDRAEATMPSPGWTGAGDWSGAIPFDELPRTLNPPGGRLVTANHKLVEDDYPYYLTDDWTVPYRAERIWELLAEDARHSVEGFARMQSDIVSLHAREFLSVARSATPGTALAREAQDLLAGWDGTMHAEDGAPLVFSAWYRAFVREVLGDELGPLFDAYYGFRPVFMRETLAQNGAWCDDVRTTQTETCADLADRAWSVATAELAERLGPNPSSWTWGAVHRVEMDHAVMGSTAMAWAFDLTAPNDGGPFTVDVASYPIRDPYRQDHGPGFRGIYDLEDLDRSRYIHGTGQSGNPLSTRYRNLFGAWLDQEYLVMDTDPAAYTRGRAEVLTLQRAP